MEKDELNEKELENVIGSPLPSSEIPDKFKQIKKEEVDELSMDELEKVYGGPIGVDKLPEDFYTEKATNERKL